METGRPVEDLYGEALAITGEFAVGAPILGGFVGLTIGLALLALSVRRRREDYEADRALCIACGRCFEYCPVERARRKGAR